MTNKDNKGCNGMLSRSGVLEIFNLKFSRVLSYLCYQGGPTHTIGPSDEKSERFLHSLSVFLHAFPYSLEK